MIMWALVLTIIASHGDSPRTYQMGFRTAQACYDAGERASLKAAPNAYSTSFICQPVKEHAK